MTITPAALLTLVNETTGRSESDVTQYLRDVVHDLEAQDVTLEGETTFALTEGQANYSVPTNYRLPIHLQPIDSSSNVYSELVEKPFAWYRDKTVYDSGNDRPTHFSVWNDTIYIWRSPSSQYTTMKIWGPLYHGDTVTSISYPDRFRKLLHAGCSFYVFERYGLGDTQKALVEKGIYDEQIRLMVSRKATQRAHHNQYNDL